MKRFLSVAVVGMAALLPLASHAQMRGMGGRGSAGFSRSSSGFRSSGFRSGGVGFRSSGTVRTFAPSRTVTVRSFAPSRRVFVGRSFGFRPFRRPFGFNRGCFGCRFPFFASSFGFGFGLGYGPYYPYYPYYNYPYYPGDSYY